MAADTQEFYAEEAEIAEIDALDPDADLADDLIEDEPEDDEPSSAETDTPGEPQSGPTSKTAASKASARLLIRRTAAKVVEIQSAESKTRAAAAALVGATGSSSSGSDDVELAVAIMTADRTALAPVNDFAKVSEADPFEASIIATELGRDRIKAVLGLLRALDAAPGGEPPAGVAKAGMALARHIYSLDAAVKAEIDKVVTLLRRG